MSKNMICNIPDFDENKDLGPDTETHLSEEVKLI